MDSPFTVASLCAGTGGLDLGIKLAVPNARTILFVERESYACEVLATRMQEGSLDCAPVWTDIRTFDGKPWRGVVDCVVGGYPCQPFSFAGKRAGENDERHLWPDIARIVAEVEPAFCFFENVSGHLSLGFGAVAADLEQMGYEVAAGLFTAAEVGASHRRERLFILARLGDTEQPRPQGHRPGIAERGLLAESSGGDGGVLPLFAPGPTDERWGAIIERWPWLAPALENPARLRQRGCERPSGGSGGGVCETGDGVDHAAGPRHNAARKRTAAVPGSGQRLSIEGCDERQSSDEIESPVRLLADGPAAWMECRTPALRAAGNGVVPLQAAIAFVRLAATLLG